MGGPRAAVTSLFLLNGVIGGSLFARMPSIKDAIGASDGQIGLSLVLATVGLTISQPLAGALVTRRGARWPALAGAVAFGAVLPLAAVAGSVGALAAVLFLMGLSAGTLDVTINVMGVAVEREQDRRILSSMHAAYSLGGMAGAAVGALAAAAAIGPRTHLPIVAVVVVAIAVVAFGRLPADAAGERGPAFARPTRALAALGLAAFCVLMAEGSVSDWSAIYLRDGAGAAAATAAAALTVFSLGMAAGRLAGDGLADRFGPGAVLRAGGLAAAAALAAGLAAGTPVVGIAAFAAMGVALGATFPMIISAAARTPGVEEPIAIAAVTTTGYAGLMAGPALIGGLSELVGLRGALCLVVALCLTAALLAPALRPVPVPA
jgi:MFS family permease